jgi:hypothetical protein
MINIGLAIPDPSDGTAHYRSSGPFRELRRAYPKEISYSIVGQQLTEGTIGFCDMYFFQRPFIDQHVQQATLVKTHKLPLWIDYDDDLSCVPSDNFTRDLYGQPQVQQNVRRMCEIADVISVSTEVLKKKLEPFNRNIIVVPNAIDTRLFHPMYGDVPRNKIVMYRGSQTHDRDTDTHKESILEAFTKYPEWTWFFVGYNPWRITEQMDSKRTFYAPFVPSARAYLEFLQSRRAAIHIVPLHDSPFNRAKSNISHLEGSIAGSAVLGPDWEEWQGGDIFRYKDPADFKTKLFDMLETPMDKLAEMNNRDWEWVLENRTLKKTNQLRMQIINTLYLGMAK